MEEGVDLVELAKRLEESPGSLAWALDGLEAVEPSTRTLLIRELARQARTSQTVELLRLLAFAPDEQTRLAAVETLDALNSEKASVLNAWIRLAVEHPSEQIRAIALSRLSSGSPMAPAIVLTPNDPPTILTGLCSAVDGQGAGRVLLVAAREGELTAALFSCQMIGGLSKVVGKVGLEVEEFAEIGHDFSRVAPRPGVVENVDLAVRLVSGSLFLASLRGSLSNRFWIERTLGSRFSPVPLELQIDEFDPSSVSHSELEDRVKLLFDECPDWLDRSAPHGRDRGRNLTAGRRSRAQRDPRRGRLPLSVRARPRIEARARPTKTALDVLVLVGEGRA